MSVSSRSVSVVHPKPGLKHISAEIPSRSSLETDEEKPAVPTIVLTPSTPTEGAPPRYPAGRLPAPNARWYFCDDDEAKLEFDGQEDPTLKPISRWPLSTRSARIAVLLAVVGLVALVHFLVIRMVVPGDDELATEGKSF